VSLSAKAAASKSMERLVRKIITLSAEFIRNNPNSAVDPDALYFPVTPNQITTEIISISDDLKKSEMKHFKEERYVSLVIDAGSIYRFHFFDIVVTSPSATSFPFLLKMETAEIFDAAFYADKLTEAIEYLKSNEITVCAIVADNLAAQQSGIKIALANIQDPYTASILPIRCLCHCLNLVLVDTFRSVSYFSRFIRSINQLQTFLRKPEAVAEIGALCPTFPETRWAYISYILEFLLDHKDSINRLLQNIETHPKLHRLWSENEYLAQFSDGLPSDITICHSAFFQISASISIFESSTSSLWMAIPVLEESYESLKVIVDSIEDGELKSSNEAHFICFIVRIYSTCSLGPIYGAHVVSSM
jgi:hypothetical protein